MSFPSQTQLVFPRFFNSFPTALRPHLRAQRIPNNVSQLQGIEWPQICQMQKHCSFLSLSWFYPYLFYVYANPNRAPGLILPTEPTRSVSCRRCTGMQWRERERAYGEGDGKRVTWIGLLVVCLLYGPLDPGRNQCERLEIILYVSNLNLMCKS